MSQEKEQTIISALREFVKVEEIEDFNVEDFLEFYRKKQEKVAAFLALPRSMTVLLRKSTFSQSGFTFSNVKEEWTTDETTHITSPSLGTFEEFSAWRDYGGFGNRYFFQEKSDGWSRLRILVVDGSAIGDLRSCIHSVSKRDLLFDYDDFWEGLIWDIVLTFRQ